MAAKKTFLFYDIETTGLNKCFDQVLQFAAIRTDEELNELSRHDIQVKLNPDVIPAPAAVMTHGIGIDTMQNGMPEVEAIRDIHALLNEPGTISVGYNTLGFDDEFLRFSFYRNLLTPYTHQYANHCGRMDLYPLTVLYYLFKPDTLQWPEKDGKPNLKLENLSRENQLASGDAHNAIVDTQACLALAKKLMAQRDIWHYAIAYFNKTTELKRLQQLPIAFQSEHQTHLEAIMIQGKFGPAAAYQAPVIGLGQHRHYNNQSLWLRLDQEALLSANGDNFADHTFVIRKRAGEAPLLLPASDHYLKYLTPERLQLANDNKEFLQQHPALLTTICNHYQDYTYPSISNIDADAALYQIGFPQNYEEFLFQRFHLAKPEEKEKIAEAFPNSVRQEQAIRVLGRHYPDFLSNQGQAQFQDYLQHRYESTDFRGQHRLSRDNALAEINNLKQQSLTPQQIKLLDQLNKHLALQSKSN